MLQHGLVTHSSSSWSSTCLLEDKSDGSPRFIINFQTFNAVTVPDSCPLPRMEDCIGNSGSAAYISKPDLLKSYWQVRLTNRASRISAFVTPSYFLQYALMAFGICNTPATLPRLVNTILAGLSNYNMY